MARMSLLLSAAALALVPAQPGFAQTANTASSQTTYSYAGSLDYKGISLPVTLTIDPVAGTATYEGNGVNITYQGDSLKGFPGGPTPPQGTYKLTSASGQIDYAGNTYKAYIDDEQDATALTIGANGAGLITNLVDKDDYRTEADFDTPMTYITGGATSGGSTGGATSGGSTGGASGGVGSTTSGGASGGTTTGGTTTGGASGGTTGGGGTEVPAPGAALLFGFGAAALGLIRRRKSAK